MFTRVQLLSSCLALSLVLASWPTAAAAEERGDEGEVAVDYLSLAATLFRDGHTDRAEAALAQVDARDPKLDLQRYHTLRGLIALKKREFAPARKAFDAAIEAQLAADRKEAAERAKAEDGDKARRAEPVRAESSLLLYAAQASYGLGDYQKSIDALERAGRGLDQEPNAFLMKADAHRKLGQVQPALATFEAGAKLFPEHVDLARLPILYLIDLGLFQEVMAMGERYLQRPKVAPDDFVAIGEALRRGKQLDKAALVLESARLRFPNDDRVLLTLANVYADQERPLTGGMLLEEAARIDPKYTLEAAELYKRARRLERALWLNGRVADQPAKAKQRLGILLELERFELVAAMQPTLSRLGLLEDDDVRYALAYGYFKNGSFRDAEQQLKAIVKPSLETSANQLRKAMESCRQQGWECF